MTALAPVTTRLAETGKHAVQFYDDAGFLAGTVSDFLTPGLSGSRPCVAVATREHALAIQEELARRGLTSADGVTYLDAREMLAGLMVNGQPDTGRFRATIGKVLGEMAALAGPGPVYAFGDMTDELWRDGLAEAVVALEDVWNDLATEHTLFLLCAYDAVMLAAEDDTRTFDEVCRRHVHVLPSRRFAATDPDRHWFDVARLEDQVRRLSQAHDRCEDLTSLVEAGADARERLLRVGSHELRNPVHALRLQLQAAMQVLSAPVADIESVRDRVSRAEAQALKLSRILDTVLSPASFAGPLSDSAQRGSEDLSVVLHRAVEAFAEERHDVVVTTAIGVSLGSCEQARVGQALRHLLTYVGSVNRTTGIHVAATAEPRVIRTRIENSPPRVMGESATLTSSERAGPDPRGGGLWMTRQLVEAMGGTFVVVVIPGEPVAYEITWPRFDE